MTRTAATRTLVAKLKRAAKTKARAGAQTHVEALERAAREAGFSSWHELERSTGDRAQQAQSKLLLDPVLPPDFSNTPNTERSTAELDTWWEKPYVKTRSDGTFDVLCLDGGAWDRPTWYGNATSIEQAEEIGAQKLARWLGFVTRPTLLHDDPPLVVRMPRRPDAPMEILYEAKSVADAQQFIDRTIANPIP